MNSDIEILQASYAKYKDKAGRKAQNLIQQIDGHKAFIELYEIAMKDNTQ